MELTFVQLKLAFVFPVDDPDPGSFGFANPMVGHPIRINALGVVVDGMVTAVTASEDGLSVTLTIDMTDTLLSLTEPAGPYSIATTKE